MSRSSLAVWTMVAGLAAWAVVLSLRLNRVADLSRLTSANSSAADTMAAPVTGAELYAASCASCHQGAGQGRHPVFPPLAGSEWVVGDPAVLTSLTLHGVSGPMQVNGVAYSGLMPSFGHLSDQELALVLTHVRTSWGNQASRLTAADIAKVRVESAGRQLPWSAEELSGPDALGAAP